jgi:hypothetical protein
VAMRELPIVIATNALEDTNGGHASLLDSFVCAKAPHRKPLLLAQ